MSAERRILGRRGRCRRHRGRRCRRRRRPAPPGHGPTRGRGRHRRSASLRSRPITVVADDGVPLHVEIDEYEPAEDDRTASYVGGGAAAADRGLRATATRSTSTAGTSSAPATAAWSAPSSTTSAPTAAPAARAWSTRPSTSSATTCRGPRRGRARGPGRARRPLDGRHDASSRWPSSTPSCSATGSSGVGPDLHHGRRPATRSRILLPVRPAIGRRRRHQRRRRARSAAATGASTGLRRLGRNVAMVVTDLFAFGDDVPAAYVDFVDEMLSGTPFEVVAEFFPSFEPLDKFDAVARARERCRPRSSAAPTTGSPRSGTAASCTSSIPGSHAAGVRGRRSHGDHGAPRPGQRRARPADRRRRAGLAARGEPVDVRRVGPEAAAEVLAVVRAGLRGTPGRSTRRPTRPERDPDRVGRAALRRRTAACSPASTASPSGALVLDPHGRHARTCAASACSRTPRATASRSVLIDAGRRRGARLRRPDRADGREELPAHGRFWERHGFREIRPGRARRRAAPRRCPPAASTRRTPRPCASSAARWPAQLRAGDLVVLSGELGAGKTTFTQGIGAGARGPRRHHLADVRDRAGAPVAGRRAGPGPRRRLPARRHRGARRPRPRDLAGRLGHRRGVGRGRRRGAGRVAARGAGSSAPWPTRRSTPTSTRGAC